MRGWAQIKFPYIVFLATRTPRVGGHDAEIRSRAPLGKRTLFNNHDASSREPSDQGCHVLLLF